MGISKPEKTVFISQRNPCHETRIVETNYSRALDGRGKRVKTNNYAIYDLCVFLSINDLSTNVIASTYAERLIYCSVNKMADILQATFSIVFHEIKVCHFD